MLVDRSYFPEKLRMVMETGPFEVEILMTQLAVKGSVTKPRVTSPLVVWRLTSQPITEVRSSVWAVMAAFDVDTSSKPVVTPNMNTGPLLPSIMIVGLMMLVTLMAPLEP